MSRITKAALILSVFFIVVTGTVTIVSTLFPEYMYGYTSDHDEFINRPEMQDNQTLTTYFMTDRTCVCTVTDDSNETGSDCDFGDNNIGDGDTIGNDGDNNGGDNIGDGNFGGGNNGSDNDGDNYDDNTGGGNIGSGNDSGNSGDNTGSGNIGDSNNTGDNNGGNNTPPATPTPTPTPTPNSPIPLSVKISFADKIYNRNTDITVESYNLIGLNAGHSNVYIGIEAVTKNSRLTEYSVSDSVEIEISHLTLKGDDADKYVLIQPQGYTAMIHPRPVTSTVTVYPKEYNGNNIATITQETKEQELVGILGDDEVYVVSWGNAEFVSRNAALQEVILHDVTLGGAQAGNYVFVPEGDIIGEITRRRVYIDDIEIERSREYDGTTDISVGGYSLRHKISGDDVYINNLGTAGSISQSDIGNRIASFNLTLSGSDAGNYYVYQPGNLEILILPREISVNIYPDNRGFNFSNVVTFSYSLNNVIASDTPDVSLGAIAPGVMGIGHIPSESANNTLRPYYTLSLPDFTLTGSRAHNYILTQPENPNVTISPAYGTFQLIGNPWLGETLTYSGAIVHFVDENGNPGVAEFAANFTTLRAGRHTWYADDEAIAGAVNTSYTLSGSDRTVNENKITSSRIGLSIHSLNGNFIFRQEEKTDVVPYNIVIVFDEYPARRSYDNATIETSFADGGSEGNESGSTFRRQLQGGSVLINNRLSDGNLGASVGTSTTDFRIASNERSIGVITTRGDSSITYIVDSSDAENGVITIIARYTHQDVDVSDDEEGFETQIIESEADETVTTEDALIEPGKKRYFQ